MSTFDEVKTRVSTMYVDLLKNIYKHITDAGVDGEKHLSKYELNMNKFLETHDESRIFRYFVQKYLHIMDDIVNRNRLFYCTHQNRKNKFFNKHVLNQKEADGTFVSDKKLAE